VAYLNTRLGDKKGQRYYLQEESNGLLLLRDDPGTLPSGFDNEWRLQAESAFDLLGDDGDDGDADGDVVVD